MAKKSVKKKTGSRLIRNIDLSVYNDYRKFLEKTGMKLGPAISQLMREHMDREKQPPSS